MIIFDIVCWPLSFLRAVSAAEFYLFYIKFSDVYPDVLCIIRWQSLLQVQKCNNVRDLYELPDFCPLNSPDLNTFISKYGAASLPEKAQNVDDLRRHLFDA